jgi:phage terminase large subunit-like protein
MFEDFRKMMEDSSFQDDETQEEPWLENPPTGAYFLGMTPVQRFILAVMLLLTTVILGVLFLLVTSKIALPIMG